MAWAPWEAIHNDINITVKDFQSNIYCTNPFLSISFFFFWKQNESNHIAAGGLIFIRKLCDEFNKDTLYEILLLWNDQSIHLNEIRGRKIQVKLFITLLDSSSLFLSFSISVHVFFCRCSVSVKIQCLISVCYLLLLFLSFRIVIQYKHKECPMAIVIKIEPFLPYNVQHLKGIAMSNQLNWNICCIY